MRLKENNWKTQGIQRRDRGNTERGDREGNRWEPREYREESEGDDRRKTGDRGYREEAEVRQRR